VRVTIKSFLVIGFMALVFLVLFKWVAGKSKIEGLQKLAAAG